jgi:hypothetical protein
MQKRGSLEKNIPASPFFAISSELTSLNEISFLRIGVIYVFIMEEKSALFRTVSYPV